VELSPSRRSDEPEAGGDMDEWSLSPASLSLFMATRTDAASRSWTCWCLEMSSFDVYCHSGVCSQLDQQVNAELGNMQNDIVGMLLDTMQVRTRHSARGVKVCGRTVVG
jgi:hypothetical protein